MDQDQQPALSGKHILVVLETAGQIGANVREHLRVYREAGARLSLCFLIGETGPETAGNTEDRILCLALSERQARRQRLRAALRLARVLRAGDFDLAVCDQYKSVASMLLAAAFSRWPGPIYGLLRGYHATDSGGRQRLYRLFRRRLTGIIALTHAQKARFAANMPWYPEDRIHVVHNYIDDDALRARMMDRDAARKALNLPGDAFVFGTIARFDPYKRMTDLLKAMAILCSSGREAQLVVIGDGREAQALRQEAKELSIADQVRFTGFLTGANRYLRALDVFVLPSEGDNFARVFLEAMAAGLPVIGVRAGGTPEVLGTQGLLAEPRNPQGLSACMQELMDMTADERQQVGERVSRWSRDQFHRQQLTEQLLSVFHGGASAEV